ncbi:RHS repeat domain-containing protein [Streptomyces sp. NPDC087901]|uniref:RHS repeat domain-containing protein n=1 Tax=Streptomyces sp. NPDC087901 TaxID=3365818 RepID=UPI003810F533
MLALLPVQAFALPPDPSKAEVPREELVLEKLGQEKLIDGSTRDANLESIAAEAPENTTEAPAGTTSPPVGDTAPVTFGSAVQQKASGAKSASAAETDPAPVPAGSLPVRLGRAPGAEMPTGTWQVGILDRAAPAADGVDGAVLTVTAPAGASVPVSVELDYKAYQNLYGADWASRLRFVQFPECYLTTPDLEECRTYQELETTNDTSGRTLTATVDTAADGTVTPASAPLMSPTAERTAFATTVAAGGDKAVVGAVDSGAGEGGSFKATPLIGDGKWAAGSSSGAFTWSYPLTVPAPPAGPTPQISFDYSSQAVDGKTSTSSPQASWIGEGWDYEPGHIERRYRTCQDDRKDTDAGAPNNKEKKYKTSDLCWVSYNAVMSLGGKTIELVRVGTTNTYRPKSDDGTRVELKTGDGVNGDDNGEYWLVTLPDGMQYSFGLNKVGGGHADTKSVFTVPVYGNHPGEPCHAAAFADSRCTEGSTKKQQAWYWGLDKVVDVHGNAMIINWAQETNYYAPNKKFKSPEQYIRGGYPTSIEYGLRTTSLTSPSARVVFNVKERCLAAGSACDEAAFNNTKDPASYRPWWDAPGNLNCKSDSKLCPAFPSFWSRKRLESVTTESARPGSTALAKVDTYGLQQSFPRDWYDTSPGLWLNKITRRGFAPGDSAGTLLSDAGVSFSPYVVAADHPLGSYLKDRQLRNLVPTSSSDPRPGFTRPRIGAISTEHGADIEVIYKGGCRTQPSVAQDKNTNACFPTRWSPDGEDEKPALSWFNKYVVDSVTETDKITGVSDRITTKYNYSGAAWAKSDDEFSKPDLRTYSDWRGYRQVVTVEGSKNVPSSGSPQTQSYAVTRYFQGMGGAVKDSKNAVTLLADDQDQYAGMVAETLTYDGSGGRVLSRTLNYPWSKQTASRDRDGGAAALLAHRTGIARSDAIQTVETSWRAVRTRTEVDPDYGLPVQVESAVVKPNGTGETLSDYTCARTEYVHNPDKGLIGLAKSVRSTATSCAAFEAADPATEVTGSLRTSYDGLAWGAVPTKGLPTTVADIDGGGTAHSVLTVSTYDPLGRVRTLKKPDGGVTETQYTPADSGGPVTSIRTINAKGHPEVTTFDPGRALPLTVTDANGRVTRMEYDGLGRLVKGWSASRSAGTQSPNVQIAYQMAVATPTVTRPTAVTVQTLKDDGGYAKQVTVYDGLMRQVQTQSDASGPGRIITDTYYNDHGLVREQTKPYLTAGDPQAAQFKRASDSIVPSLTRTRYDGLERPVRVSSILLGEPQYASVTAYHDTSTYVAPAGGAAPATNTWTDARGRVTEIQQYTNSESSQWRGTEYEYDVRGNRKKVTDPAGNTWTYTYDTRGRTVTATDPDTGESLFGYDGADRRTSVKDSRGITYTEYDELGRVKAVREGSPTAAPVKEFTFDAAGALGKPVASIRHDKSGDYISKVTGYDTDYRPTGRQTVIPANAMTTGVSGTYTYAYTYSATGKQLSATLPAAGGLAAEKVVTRYNSDGQPVSTSGLNWYTSDVTYSPYGETLRTVSGPQPYRVWTTSFTDETTGRLQRKVADRETANSHRISDDFYSYDIAGNVTSDARKVTDGATSVWDNQCFTYDALGELVHAWTSSVTTLGSGNGTGCKAAGGAVWGNRTDAEPASGPVADAPDAAEDTDSSSPDPALAASLAAAGPATGSVAVGPTSYWDSYTFDVIGNRAGMTEHSPLDPTKVTKLAYGYGTTVTGNGTSPTTVTQPHTLTDVTSTPAGRGASYTYDLAGNTKVRDLADVTQDLEWTPENRLEKITSDGVTTTYVYDADGNRILESTPSGSVLYLGETELRTAGGKITRATRAYTQDGAPTVVRSTVNGAITGHKLHVLLADHLGTGTTAVEMAAGQPLTRRAFKPYGEARGTQPATWPDSRSYLGVGIDDKDTGLTHLGAREYDQSTGRFISADPVMDSADPLQMNGYAYSRNNPVTHRDPTGLYDPDRQAYEAQKARQAHNPGLNKPRASPPHVQNTKLRGILSNLYLRPQVLGGLGDGKTATALINEFNHGQPTVKLWHLEKGWAAMSGLADVMGKDREARVRAKQGKSKATDVMLSDEDMKVAKSEAAELWKALNAEDLTGVYGKMVAENPLLQATLTKNRAKVLDEPEMADLTGRKFEIRGKSPWPVPKGEAPHVSGFAKGFGIAGGVLTVAQAPALIEEHGWGGGLWEMFEGIVDPFGVEDSSMSSPCDDNPNACIA